MTKCKTVNKNIIPKELTPQIFSLQGWIQLVDANQLKALSEFALNEAQFHVLERKEQHFPHNGYTAFWLLAESHLAIHTFTEKECTYIELSSCNKEKAQAFKQVLDKQEKTIFWEGEISIKKCPLIQVHT